MKDSRVKIGGRAFVLSAAIILALMICSGILTRIVPAGVYERTENDGRVIVVNGSYRAIQAPEYPVWRWFTSPFEILMGPDRMTPIMLIIFIAMVGGSIAIMESAGIMEALVNFLVKRFARKKYRLIVVLILFFMLLSGFVGMFEEMIPLIVFIIPVAVSLGWDSLTGLGMSLLPLAFGFSAAVTNPFTIAVAQKIAGLPLFSGAPLRLIFFLVVFCLVCFFVLRYARKVERDPASSLCYAEDEALRHKLRGRDWSGTGAGKPGVSGGQWRALMWFVSCITVSMLLVIGTARIPALSALAFPLMTLLFVIGGVGGGFFAGLRAGVIGRAFGHGLLGFLPGILLVLLAYSVKHIITTGMIMDTILYRAAELIRHSPPLAAAFLIYAVTLVMNFFIGAAGAKAFLMMPLLSPLADLTGITRQTAVLAFAFGDGFSNMFFPTNALLLIALSFSVVSYTKWIRWTWKLQLVILFVTLVFLAVAVQTGFGPF